MKAKQKAPVEARALMQRINRILAKKDWPEIVKKARPESRLAQNVGDYYSIDTQRNAIQRQHIDLEELGRELGALAEWEALATE